MLPPSSESVGNTPRLRAHHLLGSLLHLPMCSELSPTTLLLEAPQRARTSHIQQLTRQRRIKQTSKQTNSINPQITNCLCISGWLTGRASSHVSLAGCRAMGTAVSCLATPPSSPAHLSNLFLQLILRLLRLWTGKRAVTNHPQQKGPLPTPLSRPEQWKSEAGRE